MFRNTIDGFLVCGSSLQTTVLLPCLSCDAQLLFVVSGEKTLPVSCMSAAGVMVALLIFTVISQILAVLVTYNDAIEKPRQVSVAY